MYNLAPRHLPTKSAQGYVHQGVRVGMLAENSNLGKWLLWIVAAQKLDKNLLVVNESFQQGTQLLGAVACSRLRQEVLNKLGWFQGSSQWLGELSTACISSHAC